MERLEATKATLEREVGRLQADGAVGPAASARVKELEENLMALQTELTASYREKATHASTMLELNMQVKERDTRVEALAAELAAAEAAVEALTSAARKQEDSLQEKEVTVQVLQDELQALQLELVKVEERNGQLRSENNALIERWLRKVRIF